MPASSTTLDPSLRDVLTLLARRPFLPPEYLSKVLDQNPDALWVSLRAGVSQGWLEERSICCSEVRYVVTEVGKQMLNEVRR